MLKMFIFQQSYAAVVIFNTHPLNKLSKAGAALVNTISSILINCLIELNLTCRRQAKLNFNEATVLARFDSQIHSTDGTFTMRVCFKIVCFSLQ